MFSEIISQLFASINNSADFESLITLISYTSFGEPLSVCGRTVRSLLIISASPPMYVFAAVSASSKLFEALVPISIEVYVPLTESIVPLVFTVTIS